ncbi:fimbrial protein [Enterobacter quasiroggenkampii]|uniref:fimbrial protein n=1 Tax=Enterobacter TaxID=547 RepID=UPI001420B2EF|nr:MULTISPECIES: fimbrial protein [Enterobacter]MBW4237655.1 type 1 fimbrial protein [Enterobacter roggenkampii]MCU6278356.1 type 1 fimbrial protein [Enterobacter quasiroggenkampii]MCU6366239.1 type 1 fimbrial protein [Enterobacter quasiroggenkampii]NIG44038.1 type 1 fimbrial protein [Enterobacter sp. Acro-832]
MQIIYGKKMIIGLLACSGLFSAASHAVNIDITGKVVASPCVVNGNNESLAVNLGDNIQADSLATSGSATAWTDVTLRLTGCPASTTSFSVAFAGTADTDGNYYKNTGTATNLKLELTDSTSNTAYKNGATLQNVAIPASHSYDLAMRARAVSTGNVLPGTIVGQVQATFTYQ